MKTSGSEIKQIDIFAYLGSMVEKNGKIQNEINKRIRKALKLYLVISRILWNKDKV
jgi:hypothetical protein